MTARGATWPRFRASTARIIYCHLAAFYEYNYTFIRRNYSYRIVMSWDRAQFYRNSYFSFVDC